MTKQELIEKLKSLIDYADSEAGHSYADQALIEFINDPEIAEEYEKITKWYA